jgi:hypothetical protein
MGHSSVRALAGALHTTSPEVIALLFQMPHVLRSLGIATTSRFERCFGEIRGPVQWSETMSARGATAGAADLYVCSTTARAYDTAENRVLVAALATVVDAARALERGATIAEVEEARTDLGRYARRNATLALRYLDHRALSGVTRRPPTTKEIQRVRTSKRASTYLPAVLVLERAASPMGPLDVEGMADDRTWAEHTTLADVLDVLERRGHSVLLRVHRGTLTGGPVTYVHADHPSRHDEAGIHVGSTRLEPEASEAAIRRACEAAGF